MPEENQQSQQGKHYLNYIYINNSLYYKDDNSDNESIEFGRLECICQLGCGGHICQANAEVPEDEIRPDDSASNVGPGPVDDGTDDQSEMLPEGSRISVRFGDGKTENIHPRDFHRMRRIASDVRLGTGIRSEAPSEIGTDIQSSSRNKKTPLVKRTTQSLVNLNVASKPKGIRRTTNTTPKTARKKTPAPNTSTPQDEQKVGKKDSTKVDSINQMSAIGSVESPQNVQEISLQSDTSLINITPNRTRIGKEVSEATNRLTRSQSAWQKKVSKIIQKENENLPKKRLRPEDSESSLAKKVADESVQKTPPAMKESEGAEGQSEGQPVKKTVKKKRAPRKRNTKKSESTPKYVSISDKMNKFFEEINASFSEFEERQVKPLWHKEWIKLRSQKTIPNQNPNQKFQVNEIKILGKILKTIFRTSCLEIGKILNTKIEDKNYFLICTNKGAFEIQCRLPIEFNADIICKILSSFSDSINFTPNKIEFLNQGRCQIQADGIGKLPIIRRKDKTIPIREYDRWMTRKIIHFMEINQNYFRYIDFAVGKIKLDEKIDCLKGYSESYTYKSGENLLSDDVQEDDDLNLAGKPHLVEAQKELNLNSLPTTKKEQFIIQKQKTKCRKLSEFLINSKNKLIEKYRIWKNLKIIDEEDHPNQKKHFKTKKIQESDQDSSPNSLGTDEYADQNKRQNDDESLIEIARSEHPNSETEPYHHWWDGTPIYLSREPRRDEDFDEAEKIEKETSDVIEEIICLKVGYANLPHPKINLSTRNIFSELIDSFPEIDIWAICEMYWTDHSHSHVPPEFYMITHSTLKKKNTGFLIRKTLMPIINPRDSEQNETSIFVDGDIKIGLTIFYRSPSGERSPPLKHLNLPGDEDPELNYLTWMGRKIGKLFIENEGKNREIILGDFNLDIHQIGREFTQKSNHFCITTRSRILYRCSCHEQY